MTVFYMNELSEKESRGAGVRGFNPKGVYKKRVLSLSSLVTKRENVFLAKHEEITVAIMEQDSSWSVLWSWERPSRR